MIDFFLAVMAAGINSADNTADQSATGVMPTPPAIVAPIDEMRADTDPAPSTAPTVKMGEGVIIGQGVVMEGAPATPTGQTPTTPPSAAPAAPGMNMAVVPLGLVAEPQTPSGKFTTAAEIKPILNATKGNWVAVREFNGQDLLYVTHLWAWRCGLHAVAISVNDEPMQNWPLPECHMKYGSPNAVLEEDGQPYLTLKLGAVDTVDIQLVYDDLTMDAVRFERGNILIP